MSESERTPGYRKRSQVPPIVSRASRIAYVRPGKADLRWCAAPMPDRPAPMISTSKCSVMSSRGLPGAGAELRLHHREHAVVVGGGDPGEGVEHVRVRP